LRIYINSDTWYYTTGKGRTGNQHSKYNRAQLELHNKEQEIM
jgi:hypothetical protein